MICTVKVKQNSDHIRHPVYATLTVCGRGTHLRDPDLATWASRREREITCPICKTIAEANRW